MDTHHIYLSVWQILFFFQIARKRDISWRDLNRDLNLNLKRTVGALKKNAQKFVLIKKKLSIQKYDLKSSKTSTIIIKKNA